MIVELGPYRADVDVDRTRAFYRSARRVSEGCTCAGCRNYEKAVEHFPAEVTGFFAALGIDMKKICEVYVNCGNPDGTLSYGGFFHLCGTLLEGEKPAELDFVPLGSGFSAAFRSDCHLLEQDFPEPALQLEIDGALPWVLPEENPYSDQKEGEPMHTVLTLPEGYRETLRIDLQANKREMVLVNVLALVIFLVLAIPAQRMIPISTLFQMDDLGAVLLRLVVLMVGLVAYIFLHEWVHGIFMKRYSGIKATYGFTGLYAYAGSTAYFDKTHYIIIALAPVVVWGVVLAAVTALVPASWFWIVYFIQMTNLSGAAGDLYVTWKLSRLPSDLLVNDTGVAMTVYTKE